MRVPGYVYVLQNPAFPHLLKIGFTTRTPEERAEELSRHSGVPTPYRVVFSEFFEDCYAAEQEIHQILEAKRRGKEFFHVSVEEAVDVIRECKRREGRRSLFLNRSWRRVVVAAMLLIVVSLGMRSCQTRIREGETVLTAVHQRDSRVSVSGDRPHGEGSDSPDVELPAAEEPVATKESETDKSAPLVFFTQSDGPMIAGSTAKELGEPVAAEDVFPGDDGGSPMEPDVAEGVVEDELPPAVQERVEGAPEMQGGQGAPAATSGIIGFVRNLLSRLGSRPEADSPGRKRSDRVSTALQAQDDAEPPETDASLALESAELPELPDEEQVSNGGLDQPVSFTQFEDHVFFDGARTGERGERGKLPGDDGDMSTAESGSPVYAATGEADPSVPQEEEQKEGLQLTEE